MLMVAHPARDPQGEVITEADHDCQDAARCLVIAGDARAQPRAAQAQGSEAEALQPSRWPAAGPGPASRSF